MYSMVSVFQVPRILVLICAFFAFSIHATAFAQEQEAAAPSGVDEVVVHLDANLSDEEFTLRLVHLTRAELEEFAKQWIKITQKKTKEAAEINIKLSKAKGAQVEQLRDTLAGVIEHRNSLFKKQEIVLNEWSAKGATAEELLDYRNYITAIRRNEIKSTDIMTLTKWVLEWFTAPDGGRKIGIWLLSLSVSLFVMGFIARIVTGFVRRALLKIPDMSNLLQNFVSRMIYWLIMGVGIIIVLSLFGIDMTPLLAVFGGASFIIGFAMQSTLGNLASGLLLMVTKPFDVGDVVDAAGVSGTVRNVSIVSTTILTFDNQVIVVPNTMVWDSVITNVNASDTRRVDLTFGIGYDDDIELAKKTLGEILDKHPLILDDPAPNIRLHELADSSVNFICRPWVKSEDYWNVYWDIMQQAKERFDEVGLSIPYPQRDVHIHQITQDKDDKNAEA